MLTDDRYKQLMVDVGLPNSRTLLQALQQAVMEASLIERERCARIAEKYGPDEKSEVRVMNEQSDTIWLVEHAHDPGYIIFTDQEPDDGIKYRRVETENQRNIQTLFKPYFVRRKNGQCQVLIPLVELDELCEKIEQLLNGG